MKRPHTRVSHTCTPRPARSWLFMCLSIERYDTHTRHAPDHSRQSRASRRDPDRQSLTSTTLTACHRAFDSKVPTCHTSTRSAARPFANARAAFYWQSNAPQRRPKAPTSADLLDRDPLPMGLGGDYDDAGLPRRPNHAPPGRARRKGRSVRPRTWLGWG